MVTLNAVKFEDFLCHKSQKTNSKSCIVFKKISIIVLIKHDYYIALVQLTSQATVDIATGNKILRIRNQVLNQTWTFLDIHFNTHSFI